MTTPDRKAYSGPICMMLTLHDLHYCASKAVPVNVERQHHLPIGAITVGTLAEKLT